MAKEMHSNLADSLKPAEGETKVSKATVDTALAGVPKCALKELGSDLMMNLDLEIGYDSNVEVEFIDLSGKLIMRSAARPVKEGRNILQYNINKLATEVHMMKVQTDRELLMIKVLFVK